MFCTALIQKKPTSQTCAHTRRRSRVRTAADIQGPRMQLRSTQSWTTIRRTNSSAKMTTQRLVMIGMSRVHSECTAQAQHKQHRKNNKGVEKAYSTTALSICNCADSNDGGAPAARKQRNVISLFHTHSLGRSLLAPLQPIFFES